MMNPSTTPVTNLPEKKMINNNLRLDLMFLDIGFDNAPAIQSTRSYCLNLLAACPDLQDDDLQLAAQSFFDGFIAATTATN